VSYSLFEDLELDRALAAERHQARTASTRSAVDKALSLWGSFVKGAKTQSEAEARIGLLAKDISKEIAPGAVRTILAVLRSLVSSEEEGAEVDPSDPNFTDTGLNPELPLPDSSGTEKPLVVDQQGIRGELFSARRAKKAASIKEGWSFNPTSNVYEALDDSAGNFTCTGCLTEVKHGYNKCGCGKTWNSYTVQTKDGVRRVCREVQHDKQMILASRRVPKKESFEFLTEPLEPSVGFAGPAIHTDPLEEAKELVIEQILQETEARLRGEADNTAEIRALERAIDALEKVHEPEPVSEVVVEEEVEVEEPPAEQEKESRRMSTRVSREEIDEELSHWGVREASENPYTGVNLDHVFQPRIPLGHGMSGNVPGSRDDLDPGVSDQLDKFLDVRQDFASWADANNADKELRPFLPQPFKQSSLKEAHVHLEQVLGALDSLLRTGVLEPYVRDLAERLYDEVNALLEQELEGVVAAVPDFDL